MDNFIEEELKCVALGGLSVGLTGCLFISTCGIVVVHGPVAS